MPQRFVNDKILDAVTLATTVTSDAYDISMMYCYSVMLTVAGAAISGTVQVQCSNDTPLNGVVTNWVNVGSAVTLTVAGSQFVEKDAASYRWLRVVYTTAAGTGTLSATICAKG